MKNTELIFGLMAAFGKTGYSIADLAYLSRPFQVTETNLRTILSRMYQKDLVIPYHHGKKVFYKFSPKGSAISLNISRSFSSLDWQRWDQSWWGIVFSVPDIKKEDRYRIRKKLAVYRFVPRYPGFWIRPHHEKENISENLKFIFSHPHCSVIIFYPHSEISRGEIRRLWKLFDLNHEFKREIKKLEIELQKIKTCSSEQALLKKMEIGSSIIPVLFKDPLLPSCYLPDNWQADELRRLFLKWDKEISQVAQPYWRKIFEMDEV